MFIIYLFILGLIEGICIIVKCFKKIFVFRIAGVGYTIIDDAMFIILFFCSNFSFTLLLILSFFFWASLKLVKSMCVVLRCFHHNKILSLDISINRIYTINSICYINFKGLLLNNSCGSSGEGSKKRKVLRCFHHEKFFSLDFSNNKKVVKLFY